MARRTPFLTLAAALLVALVAGPLAAYTIYLKDGSRIAAKDKYRVEGERAIIVLPNGTETSIAAAEIDVARTEEANRSNYGTALVIEGGETSELKPAPQRQQRPELRDLIASRGATPQPEQRPTRSTSREAEGRSLRTAGGHPDLATVPRSPFPRLEQAAELQQLFRAAGVEEVSVYRGTAADRPLVEITTNSEAAIFRSLEAAAAALLELQQKGVRFAALELLMMSSSRERAGQFALTPEMAAELRSDRIEASAFFVKYVQF